MLRRYDSPKTVFYLDPPYPQNGVNYHHNMRSLDEHLKMVQRLSGLRGRWILSTYRWMEEHVRRAVPDVFVQKVSSYSGMRKGKHLAERVENEEILVANFPPTEEFVRMVREGAKASSPAQAE